LLIFSANRFFVVVVVVVVVLFFVNEYVVLIRLKEFYISIDVVLL